MEIFGKAHYPRFDSIDSLSLENFTPAAMRPCRSRPIGSIPAGDTLGAQIQIALRCSPAFHADVALRH